jgi:ABC-type transport system involved in multi-copper enzyme maturation permease subunit
VIALVSADVLKLRRRRGVWYSTLFIPAGLSLVIGMLGAFIDSLGVRGGGQFTDDALYALSLMTTVIAALVGARLGADEHSLQTFRYQVLSGRPRAQLFASKAAALAVVMTIAVFVATAVTVLSSYLPPADPSDTVSLSDLGVLFWELWLPAIVYGWIALGVGSLLRASGGAIALSLVLQLIGQNLIALLAGAWSGFKYLVVYGALDRVGADSIHHDDKFRQSLTGAIICICVWTLLFLAAGLIRTQRSED